MHMPLMAVWALPRQNQLEIVLENVSLHEAPQHSHAQKATLACTTSSCKGQTWFLVPRVDRATAQANNYNKVLCKPVPYNSAAALSVHLALHAGLPFAPSKTIYTFASKTQLPHQGTLHIHPSACQ